MADILEYLNTIKNAVYGKDVRQAIVDGISQCYTDGKAGVNDLQARQLIEAVAAVNEEQTAALEVLQAKIEELEESEGGTQQSTTVDIPTVLVDGGVEENVAVNNNSTVIHHVTFTTEFTEIPKVMVAIGKNVGAVSQYGYLSANILYPTITKTGFDFFLANRTGSDRSPGVVWYAYQPTVETIDLDITIPDAQGMTESQVRAITGPISAAVDAIKTGYDGTVYQTAAEAIRTQINALHVLIGDEPGTAISADSIGYEDGSVSDALDGLNERLALLKEPVVITHSETVEKGYHVLTFDEPILKGTEVTVIGTAATTSNSFTAIFRDSNGNPQNLGTLGISTKKLTGVLEFDAVDFRSFVNGTEWGFTITYGEGVVAEVEDVREGVNGVVYGSAGEAVRTQVKGIEDVVNIVGQKTLSLLDIDPSATTENWTLKANGLSESNNDGRIRKYSVTPGQLLFLSISKDTYGVYQFQNNANIPGSNINNYLVGYPVTEAVDGFVVVPEGATYLIVSQLKTNVTNAIKLADSGSATDIISLNEGIRSLMIQAARPKNLSYNAYLNEPKPLMLLHFSDIHGDSTELARMVEFADSNSDMIDDTICTGDVLATRWSSDFNYWSATPGAEKILLAVGNHDVLTDTSGWDWSQRASQADQYTRFFAPFIGDWECSYESGKTYYYKDYDDSKIRLIVLNCMLIGSDDTAQLTWLGTALSGAKAKDYSVVVANHYMIATPTKIPCNFSSIDKGVGSDVLPTAYLSSIQNFIDDSGKFVCHIAGHTHWDIVVRSQDYPRQICIVVDALSRTQGNYYSDTQRTNGDKSQDLANVVAFDTSSGVVKVMRVGADTDHYLRQKHCLTIDYATGNIVAES